MANINVYAEDMKVEADGKSLNVYLIGVNPDQVLSEMSAKEIYDALVANDQMSSIIDLLAEDSDNE